MCEFGVDVVDGDELFEECFFFGCDEVEEFECVFVNVCVDFECDVVFW